MSKGRVVTQIDVVGPFLKRFRKSGGLRVSVGVQGAQAAQDRGGITQGELVNVLEFGSEDGKIPARPAFAMTFDMNEQRYAKALQAAQALVLLQGGDVKGPLLEVGERYRADVVRNVARRRLPLEPNAPSTIARKGSDVPLADTGQLYLRSITVEVKK